MGKRIVSSKPLIKGGQKKIKHTAGQTGSPEVKAHYTKAVNVKSSKYADKTTLDYWLQQIYSPSDSENPLRGIWNRANHLRSVGYDHGKPMLVKMSPQEFLDLTPTPNEAETEWKLPAAKKAIESGEWEERSMISEGPFIDIDESGRVTTHEGRHRAMALIDMDKFEMPVLIYDRSKRGENWREEEPWMRAEVQALNEARRR